MTEEKIASTSTSEAWLSRDIAKILTGIIITAIIASVVTAGFYIHFLGELPIARNDPSGWGQLGDFLGGVLNPVFGFLTIIALVLTLILQSRELRLSREELELSRVELRNSAEALRGQNKAIDRQSFEQTFFTWLNTYRDLLTSVESGSGESLVSGRRALERWRASYLRFSKTIKREGEAFSISALANWHGMYEKQEYQLDSIFRVLYRLIVWIDSQDDDRLTPAQKWLYVSIVRAQLSWIELVYLFYNGHTERGKNFKRLAEKYALFDNLNFTTDPVITIVRECPPDAVGYQPSAYDSRLARVAMGLPESSEQTLAMASDR